MKISAGLIAAMVLGSLFAFQVRAQDASSSTDTLSPNERAALVAKAEAEARDRFQADHYVFLTRHGRVDPAEGGIPAFALGDRSWTLYRGVNRVSEVQLLRNLGRHEDARALRRHRIVLYGVAGVATVAMALAAASTDIMEAPDRRDLAGGIVFVGSFGTIIFVQTRLGRHAYSVDQLFYDVQMLNDQIREGIRAQVRLEYGIPLEVPTTRQPSSDPSSD